MSVDRLARLDFRNDLRDRVGASRAERAAARAVRLRKARRTAASALALLAVVGIAAAGAGRRAAPDLLWFAGIACAPLAVYLAFGVAAGVGALCPALIIASHALRPSGPPATVSDGG